MCSFNPMIQSHPCSQSDSPLLLKKALEAENFLMTPLLSFKDNCLTCTSRDWANQIRKNYFSYARLIHWIQGTVMPMRVGLSQTLARKILENTLLNQRVQCILLCGSLGFFMVVSCCVSQFQCSLQQAKITVLSRERVHWVLSSGVVTTPGMAHRYFPALAERWCCQCCMGPVGTAVVLCHWLQSSAAMQSSKGAVGSGAGVRRIRDQTYSRM